MATSQNGYTANDQSRTQVWTIPGTSRTVRLRKGSPGELLTLWAAWFDKNVEDVEGGVFDDWGYAERPIRGSTTTLSNHASGTALDLNATRHVLGKRDTFTAAQTKAIRDHLKTFDGCIRWGGDYQNRADEMHFEIVASVAKCDATLEKVKARNAPKPAADPYPRITQARALLVAAGKKAGPKRKALIDTAIAAVDAINGGK